MVKFKSVVTYLTSVILLKTTLVNFGRIPGVVKNGSAQACKPIDHANLFNIFSIQFLVRPIKAVQLIGYKKLT